MERLYEFLGDPVVVDISGWLDSETDSGENSLRESDSDSSHDQSSVQESVSGSEGVVSKGASIARNMIAEEMDLGDGTVRRTSLAKREC